MAGNYAIRLLYIQLSNKRRCLAPPIWKKKNTSNWSIITQVCSALAKDPFIWKVKKGGNEHRKVKGENERMREKPSLISPYWNFAFAFWKRMRIFGFISTKAGRSRAERWGPKGFCPAPCRRLFWRRSSSAAKNHRKWRPSTKNATRSLDDMQRRTSL